MMGRATNHVLFETGGNGRGTSIFLNATTLTFRSQQGTNPGQFAEVMLSNLAVGEFHQIVATIDMESNQISEIELFHNGTSVNTAGPANNGGQSDWDGGDGAGLGTVNSAVAGGGSFTDFDGDIAILRYYRDMDFDQLDAQQNFDALVPEPNTFAIALVALVGVCMAACRSRILG